MRMWGKFRYFQIISLFIIFLRSGMSMMTHSHQCLGFGLRSPDTISSRLAAIDLYIVFWISYIYLISYIWRLHCDEMCCHNTNSRMTRITLFQGAIKLKCSSSLLTIYWQSSMVSDNITHYQICSLQYLHFQNCHFSLFFSEQVKLHQEGLFLKAK